MVGLVYAQDAGVRGQGTEVRGQEEEEEEEQQQQQQEEQQQQQEEEEEKDFLFVVALQPNSISNHIRMGTEL